MNGLLPSTTQGLILDMDGVLWQDAAPIGDLGAIFAHLRNLGIRVALATNNSTRTAAQYLERLRGFGVDALDLRQIVTSAHAAAHLLKKRFPQGGGVYPIGEDGLMDALNENGFTVLKENETQDALAVVLGMDRGVNFRKLREATLLIRRGVPFYATNPDKTFPTPEGLILGAGALIACLTAATDVDPIVAGKPQPDLLELALERIGTSREHTFVVGDRLETDIAGGQAIHCPTALVLSGVSTRAMGAAWSPRVDVIAADLATLIGL
jgi:4-nitrophenyl phosphatase